MVLFGVASSGRILIVVVLIWIILILFIGGPLFRKTDNDYNVLNNDNGEMILARLSRATSELNTLKKQNEELKNLLQNYIPLEVKLNDANAILNGNGEKHPTKDFEVVRRSIKSNFNELWFYLAKRLNTSSGSFISDFYNNMMYDLDDMSKRDNGWRKAEMKKLTDLVESKIHKLQNPEDCNKAKKLSCQLNKGCGFGCQIHHVAYCLVVALATGRTLILNAQNWRYAHSKDGRNNKKAWELVFKPLSNTCLIDKGNSRGSWKSEDEMENIQVLDLPIVDSLHPRPKYLPLTIPEQISTQLITLHGAPIVWFMGQLVKYIMRSSPEMETFMQQTKNKFKFQRPIVGIHVRRTDKVGTEAAYHPLSEYMEHAERFFQQLEFYYQKSQKIDDAKVERRVYLATDEPSIWTEDINPYKAKGYEFLGDSNIAQSAGVGKRYSVDSLRNVILDIILLSQCDYIVCTFSSQVCRLAYELMQARGTDPEEPVDFSDAFRSLDDIYYFGGQSEHNQIAILSHKGSSHSDISMRVGDLLGIAGNHWNGYSKGVNRRTKAEGLYPGFKAEEKIETVPFKAFD